MNREAALAKTEAVNTDQKERWASVLIPEMMSSEDSCCDDDSEEDAGFVTRPLPWRSDREQFLWFVGQKD